ncbi:peptidoglycan/LPS O-acetylase OafA/YrhL [Sphingomonas sp. F9_3S_D5_B_2]
MTDLPLSDGEQVAPTTAVAKPKSRQDNIDLLRALAILSVVIYHYTSRYSAAFYRTDRVPFRFPLGHHGVDLFFTVSGFCIFMTLDSSTSLENFWARRFARIQPAYVVGIILTTAALTIGELPSESATLGIALSNMFWLNALSGWPQVDGAYWSLVVELKFYFLIGLTYYLMRGRSISLAWLLMCVVGAFLRVEHAPLLIADGVFLSDYAPSFLFGLLAWECRRIGTGPTILIASGGCFVQYISGRFADGPALGPIMALGGLLVLQMRWLRVPRPITYVGLVSYSLYLLHQNIGYLLIRTLPFGIHFRLLAAFLIVLALAGLMYAFVERRWERLMQRRIELLLSGGRQVARIPRRSISHPSLSEEMRAW